MTQTDRSYWLRQTDWKRLPNYWAHCRLLRPKTSMFGLLFMTLRYGDVSVVLYSTENGLIWVLRIEKYLQAAKALNYAQSLDAEHPELHIRTIDFQKRSKVQNSFVFTCLYLLLRSLCIASITSNPDWSTRDGVPYLAATRRVVSGCIQLTISSTTFFLCKSNFSCCKSVSNSGST